MILVRLSFVLLRGLSGISLNRIGVLDTILLILHITGMILLPAEYILRHRPASMDYYLPDYVQWVGVGIFIIAIAVFCLSQNSVGPEFFCDHRDPQRANACNQGFIPLYQAPNVCVLLAMGNRPGAYLTELGGGPGNARNVHSVLPGTSTPGRIDDDRSFW